MKKSELLKEILTEEEHIRTALKFFEAHRYCIRYFVINLEML